jgi:DNA-binding transcriptional regulator YbjK
MIPTAGSASSTPRWMSWWNGGMTGMTHRHVAARADVPLGSVTYHFAGLAELQAQAFARFVELRTAVFERLFDDVGVRRGRGAARRCRPGSSARKPPHAWTRCSKG